MKPAQPKYRDPDRKDWIYGTAGLVIYIAAITLGALLLFTAYWYLWPVLVLGGIVILVLQQTRNYACRCRKCGAEFEISFWINLFSPHGVDKKGSWQWVKCPNCHQRTKVTVIRKIPASKTE